MTYYSGMRQHISDHDLERYYLGQITAEAELASVEEHLLWCDECIDLAENAEAYVNCVRIALMRSGDEDRLKAKIAKQKGKRTPTTS